MEKNRSNWNVGDTCVLIVSIPKRYTQEFEVKGFDGKYYTLKHGNSIHTQRWDEFPNKRRCT